jgi:hypothetical protein
MINHESQCQLPDPGPVPPDPTPFPSSKQSLPNPRPPNPPTRPPISQLLISLFATACFSPLGMWSAVSAQQSQQDPAVISPVPQVGAGATGGIPAKISTPATSNRMESSPGRREDAKGFRSAGRGLPGMPGGPPLTSPLGAREARPPTVGPLYCDPVVDFPC